MTTDSYTGRMQRNPQLALAKVMEEFWEVVASHPDDQISECSDLFVHVVMYLNGIGISIEDIFNELNARRWALKTLNEQQKISDEKSNQIILGITALKYTDKTDHFAEEELGIKIIRHTGRSMLVEAEIIDRDKFRKYFGDDENMKLSLFTSKPKDMAWLLASKRVTHIITFETVIKNYPTIYTVVHEAVEPTHYLALICRKGACIEPEKWTHQNKPLIAAEYICHVTRFFEQINVNHQTYHLDRVTGSSEGFLINSDKYLLADAVVESGKTLDENNLEIWKIIIPKEQLHVGLYGCCN
jgi:phosphoribosyl-ATP pyrophosphohydrolase